jgi:hypothetical protein
MAVAQLNLSRRALLGGLCAGPLVGALAGGEVSSGPDLCLTFGPAHAHAEGATGAPAAVSGEGRALAVWSRARTRFGKAEAALDALAGGEDEPRYNRAAARHDAALQRLLATPAPDARTLADKIDLLIAHQAWELTEAETILTTLSADARRLAAPRR